MDVASDAKHDDWILVIFTGNQVATVSVQSWPGYNFHDRRQRAEATKISREACVDVVVEGKITPEEGMDEVLQTMVDMKSLVHGILRVTCEETGINGRIGFAHDGYILGAKVNVTNETGYEALRKLLTVKRGNYAVLDAGEQHTELNQTLWIKAQKVIPALSNLPETPESLTEAKPTILKANVEKPGGQIDFNVPVEKLGSNSSAKKVADVKGKVRRHDQASLRFLITLVILAAVIFILTTVVSHYGDTLFKAVIFRK